MNLTLAERILQVNAVLSEIPHAFGGALALAYYAEPRATVDVDLNVFLPTSDYLRVAERLIELGIDASSPRTLELVDRDGQVRVFWDDVPIDIFLSYDAFHEAMAVARRSVPFAGETIDVLSPEHLMVCKVVFNRPKDWIDLDAMLASGTELDPSEVLRWVARIVGDEDSRYSRAVALLTRR
jgi:Nucleotidyl transferase AbiEii toxin, Type IV TA system